MPTFTYEAKTRTGEVRTGTMEADDEASVGQRLRQQQLQPVKVAKKGFSFNFGGGGTVTTKDLVIFTRQFSTMIDAGLPLVQCLDILGSQIENPAFARVLRTVKNDVEGGLTFSDSLAKHPRIFDHLFCNLVRAGEIGGILDTILQRLAAYIEKNAKLVRQVKSALTYPIGVMFIAVAVIAVMMIFVIPTFEAMFKEFGGELPGLTQTVINASHFFVNNVFALVGGTVGSLYAFSYWKRTPNGTRVIDRALLQFPVIGGVMRKIAVARFTRTLGTLLSSGVPILDAMEIVAKSSGNYIIEQGIMTARAKIAEGKNMAEPLAETQVFPSMVVQMIAVGEQTGALDTMLNKIADFYEEEVDVAVSAMTSLLEPIMMVFIGGSVGTMIIAMYLPIFTMAGNVKAG
ncbi:MAG: type II secretion system F family protein [Deltaproteobacteria bacterium]|nr:type II secretion system F family protein [Myxococcales bacterium]MDP3214695.1 type II secretion system F family protein [Deltaproteobacteria bacterium]